MKNRWMIVLVMAAVAAAGFVLAEEKAPPKELVYTAKSGDVTFNHAKHVEAAKNDCTACHDKLFKQVKGELGYKEGMHKPAETNKKSCGACHVAGGAAFESKGNCNKCHIKKAS